MRSSVPRPIHAPGVSVLLALLGVLGASLWGSLACGPTACCAPPPPSSRALITVRGGRPVVSTSARPGFTYQVAVNSIVTEEIGVGASLNYVRMNFLRAGLEIERQEVSSADLIRQTGSNRLEGRSTRSLNLVFDTNAETATSALVVHNFTDDLGNNLDASFTITF